MESIIIPLVSSLIGGVLSFIGSLIGMNKTSKIAQIEIKHDKDMFEKVQKQEENQSKKRLSLELLRDWNDNTSENSLIIKNKYRGFYDKCRKITCKEINALFELTSNKSSINKITNIIENNNHYNDNNSTNIIVKQSIIKILNYFEYVASAYSNNAVNKEILNESLIKTMVRTYFMLSTFVLKEIAETGRNPWRPYTIFVEKRLDKFNCYDNKSRCKDEAKCRKIRPKENMSKEDAETMFNQQAEMEKSKVNEDNQA